MRRVPGGAFEDRGGSTPRDEIRGLRLVEPEEAGFQPGFLMYWRKFCNRKPRDLGVTREMSSPRCCPAASLFSGVRVASASSTISIFLLYRKIGFADAVMA